MRKLIAIVAATLFLGVASAASAQSTDDEANVIYQKKTTISFDDDTIDGDLTRPDGAYVESRKRVRHSNLIRIRENFDHEIMNSVSRI
jgi:hypothetical protein